MEDLLGSTFYQGLKRLHPDLHDRAAAEDWTVVVPAQWPGAAPSRDELDSHLLQPSPYFLGAYVSTNGRSVEMSDDERRLIPREAWPAGAVAARVVGRDSVYSSEFKAITVLRVDRALTGGGEAGAAGGPRRPTAAAQRAQVVSLATLRADPANEKALSWLTESLRIFNESYVSVAGFEEYTVAKLNGLLEGALHRLIEGSPALGGDGDALRAAAFALEAHTMSTCSEKTLGVVRAAHSKSDATIEAVCARMAASAETVGQLLGEPDKPDQVASSTVAEIGELLRAMEVEPLPREKGALAAAAWNVLSAAATGDGALDEILPTWLFCISRSGCRFLASEVVYLTSFFSLLDTGSTAALVGGASSDSDRSQQQYVVVNLQAAVSFFTTEAQQGRWAAAEAS